MDEEKSEKLKKLLAKTSKANIGGKGTVRRKKKVNHVTRAPDEKKVNSTLQKLHLNQVGEIQEANMFKDDGTVIHFKNPKVQGSNACNTFAISGSSEVKTLNELMPGILCDLGREGLACLLSAQQAQQSQHQHGGCGVECDSDDNSIPDVNNFEEVLMLAAAPADPIHEPVRKADLD